MDYEYDYLVFIGRFQPVHFGHIKIIEEALKRARNVLVCIGSANSGRTLRNPFTFQERVSLIQAYPQFRKVCVEQGRLQFLAIDDHTYADQDWMKQIQTKVGERIDEEAEVGLIGCSKDNSTYYLKLFPQWNSVDIPVVGDLNSTAIRQKLFTEDHIDFKECPKEVNEEMLRIINKDYHGAQAIHNLTAEYEWVQKYKKLWAGTPYPVIFNTVDAVVIQSGHILLVRRKAYPGKGLWALPGGYINPDENLEQSMLRELKEETKIQVDDWTIRECTKKSETFADPNRSPRGRVITHAFLVKLPDKTRLPKVKGSDDAEKAKWVPLADIRMDQMFEDHGHIIRKMTAGL